MDQTEELIRQDIAHLWHPFTQMKIWPDEPPLIIERGEGNWLIDSTGRRYFDGVSSLWVTVHGHNHPSINQAIREQLDLLDHSTLLGLSHPKAVELAAELARICPGDLSHAFYSESGSTAVEIALKIAYQYWQQTGHPQKKTFVALGNAYHGDTIGAVSVGGIELFHQVYGPLLFPVHRLPQPFCRQCPLGLTHPECDLACAQALDPLLSEHGEDICGLVVEPRVQGAAGMIIQPEGYLKRLWDICQEHDVLFIADEVATGFSRTGKMFACELEGIEPDLMALGKGITGGVLPLAATMASDRVYEGFLGEFDDFKTFFHGHTYTGNPLACAAALANLALMRDTGLVASLEPKIKLAQKWPGPHRQTPPCNPGAAAGHDGGNRALPGQDQRTRPIRPEDRMGHQAIMAVRKYGVIVRPLGDTVILMPPLASSPEELELLLDAVYKGIQGATEK
jgi:adenosylmethionine-8-amino-7-oxononanoate aminotransferase